MARERYSAVTPEGWEGFAAEHRFSTAVRVGPFVLCSGATGMRPDGTVDLDPELQFRTAFEQIAVVLAAADCSWADVVEMTSYHTDQRKYHDIFKAVRAEFVKAPFPAWTSIGVANLSSPDLLVEIRVMAVSRDAIAE
jgi:enamine deaminase RidA (YjgF/YER057c/UK114 family)